MGPKAERVKKNVALPLYSRHSRPLVYLTIFCSLLLTHWTLVIGRAFVNIFPQRMGREGGQGAYPL